MTSRTPYKPRSSQIFTTEVTAAAREGLEPTDRLYVDLACERLVESLHADEPAHGRRRSGIGPALAREIVAALGRFMVERSF